MIKLEDTEEFIKALNNNELEAHGNGDGTYFYTNLNYWDCECENYYIRPIEQEYCSLCNSYQEDYPNSRQNEIQGIEIL